MKFRFFVYTTPRGSGSSIMDDRIIQNGILFSIAQTIGAPEQALRLLVSILLGCIWIDMKFNKSQQTYISDVFLQGIRLLSSIASTSGTNLPLYNIFSLPLLESLLGFSTLVSFIPVFMCRTLYFKVFVIIVYWNICYLYYYIQTCILEFNLGWDIGHSFGCVLVQYLLIKILSGTRICVALSFTFHMAYLLLGI